MHRRAYLISCLATVVFLLVTTCAGRGGTLYVDDDANGDYANSLIAEEPDGAARVEYVPNEIIVKFRENAADAIEVAMVEGASVSELDFPDSLDRLNKKYRLRNIKALFKNFKRRRQWTKQLPEKDKALLTRKERHILSRLKRAPENVRVPDLGRIYKIQVELNKSQSLQEAVEAYKGNPYVEYAELNYIVSTNLTPNDPLYPLQWSLNNTGQVYPESGKYNTPPGTPDCDIDAPEAWELHTGSSEVIVAVVDTGVDYAHRDLDENTWVNSGEIPYNGIDDDENGYIDDMYGYDFCTYEGETRDSDPMDDSGHGTHCAGTIAAEGNNALDIAGVCWDARIMALKFLDAGGTGHTSDAVVAFYYAVDNGADVISNSWGGGGYSETMEEAIGYAHSQGVIMVASAGNKNNGLSGYPARYEHVISVAATDSNDQKASFSNYGDTVDIAAPGVDILSLRANRTSRGTVYDDYTTVASGTSMACPHVAGACALLLSTNMNLTTDEVYNIVMETADPIAPEICQSGRLNLYNAIVAAVSSKGYIKLDHDYYSCASVIGIRLGDCDLAGRGSQEVTIKTTGGDLETLFLSENTPATGIFTGTILTTSGGANSEDGMVQVAHDQIITVTYEDTNDGTGNPAIAEDSAIVDCEPPGILNIEFDQYPLGPEPTITFETDEPTTAHVFCGLACGGEYIVDRGSSSYTTIHVIKLIGVSPATDYFFVVEITDVAGNTTIDDNDGQCYVFATDVGPRDINVPSQYATIQEAVDISWDGTKVWVADGVYTGQGNRDIDFLGKKITVLSVNGPNNCIIDCNGTESEPHRGFCFVNYEDASSAIVGMTIINGYAGRGGGVYCRFSSPTIDNCVIKDSLADEGGGMLNKYNSHPMLNNCTFTGNSATDKGGGIFNKYNSSPRLTNCTFTANLATNEGGGMYNLESHPIVTNCTFNENSAAGVGGGGMYNEDSNPTVTNCTFVGNSSISHGGGICNQYRSSPTISNCTFHSNSAQYRGGGVYNTSKAVLTNCTFTDNEASSEYGDGGGMHNDAGPTLLTSCAFIGNRAGRSGGGIHNNEESDTTMNDCTFIGNSAVNYGGGMSNVDECTGTFTNCIFTGNSSANNGGGVFNDDNNAMFANCIISGNSAVNDGGGMFNDGCAPILTNCTFSGNLAGENTGGIYNKGACYMTLTNCILWGDVPDELYVDQGTQVITYCDIKSGWPGVGNINVDPSFVEPGCWVDVNDPNIGVEPNDPNAVWVEGDYHLKSQAGRWEPFSQTWVQDDVASPCVDAGDPMSPVGHEPFPNGGRVNMGAYGGTVEASKSYFDQPVCETIVAGDINGDCKVNFKDFAFVALNWLREE